MAVTFEGYDLASGRLTLCHRDGEDSALLTRTLPDIQHIDRTLHRLLKGSAHERLPMRRLKKLLASSWSLNDVAVGKKPELAKALSVCNKWLATLLKQLPANEAHAFLDEAAYAERTAATSARLLAQKAAKDHGQFFSSASSIAQAMAGLEALFTPTELSASVFLEPSCGDGRFFSSIQRVGGKDVRAFEIDPLVAASASQQAASLGLGDIVSVGDFLRSATHLPASARVLAVGNPPFSAKDTDADDDLVLAFLRHCALEWRATAIAFILPERCHKPAYNARVLEVLATSAPYQLAHAKPLPDSAFDFVGAKRIQKPSVIHIYTRLSSLNSRTEP
ncbi:hypothetical protein SPRG_11904 [Saprolegnia parasitica CBS 223.65]|uniref:DNA methylase adenine-specific domain-containing protein n=1 Tax=Saprolegnia parasitica (strain CBS 223.65) TaxID=695850 RepID=A0A067C8B7_SAPPC|nr:hypothetical protein SPRG_11904 [Saprolegnia parasitica CBS 223.65]KDO23057.1 hypothetical protein SPRG_11904 [Saprolegnia parasitica CBS 223.65]|eukprot:XP_012206174.1 hypothetical protein SPRG_11904 [Saprolegnia parasitica CBS 223.65]